MIMFCMKRAATLSSGTSRSGCQARTAASSLERAKGTPSHNRAMLRQVEGTVNEARCGTVKSGRAHDGARRSQFGYLPLVVAPSRRHWPVPGTEPLGKRLGHCNTSLAPEVPARVTPNGPPAPAFARLGTIGATRSPALTAASRRERRRAVKPAPAAKRTIGPKPLAEARPTK